MGVLEAMALDLRHLKDNSSCLGLEHLVLDLVLECRVLALGLRGQVFGLRGKALGLDPFSLVCLVFLC